MAVRVEFFGDEIDGLYEVDPTTGKIVSTLAHSAIFPASHYVVGEDIEATLERIKNDMIEECRGFKERKQWKVNV